MNEIKQFSARANIITRRTYCREKEDGSFENWEEVIERAILHQKWLWERALTHKVLGGANLSDITEDMLEWVSLEDKQLLELEELRWLMLNRKALPSGRALWMSGTEISRTRESSMFNCAFTNIETVYDFVDVFWLLLQGCGVGFSPIIGSLSGFRKQLKEIKVIPSTRGQNDKGCEFNEESFEDGVYLLKIADDAKGWAKALGKLLANKYPAHTLVLDFSEIRGAGKRLKNYGWISSGSEGITKAFVAIAEIMSKNAGNILKATDIVQITNWIGTVLSSRRSAQLALVDYGSEEWYEFATLKKDCYQEGKQHLQQSNNSLAFHKKPTKKELTELFDMLIDSGGSEPGFYNMEAAKNSAPYAQGTNPCGEQLLPNKGFCNLVELNVAAFQDDLAGQHKAMNLIARCNMRQTVVDLRDGILQEAWHNNNTFLRLCGTGITGIAQRNIKEFEYKNLKYSAVVGARNMATELGVEWPKNVSTVDKK